VFATEQVSPCGGYRGLVSSSLGTQRSVALLDVDPDLGEGLDSEQLKYARGRSVAPVIRIEPPAWDPATICDRAEDGWLGLSILDGLLIRRVKVGSRLACELFGPTDLIRPWDTDGQYDPVPIAVDWLVIKPTRLAVLDTAFMLRIAAWPAIAGRLVSRVAHRARYLALTQAVTHMPRAHARLIILFWLLAERWGTVTTDGVYVTLPLTHELLAMLIGSHRPTVTIALQRLNRSGLLIRERSDRWLLTNRGVEALGDPDALGLIGAEGDGIDPDSASD
jgi:CRP/FNR family transcriptional regulator, cyclic AMP receptor protein